MHWEKKKKQQVEDMQIIKDILSNGHGTCNSFFLFACLLYPSGHKKKINVFLPNSNGVIKSLNTKTLKKKKKKLN